MRKRKLLFTLLAAATLMVNTSVWAESDSEIENYTRNADYGSEPYNSKGEESMMEMMVGDMPVTVDWEENESVEALKELAAEDLTIEMSMYGGFEQVGSIGQKCLVMIHRRPPLPATSFSIQVTSWWCSTAAIHGRIPGWGRLSTKLLKRWKNC